VTRSSRSWAFPSRRPLTPRASYIPAFAALEDVSPRQGVEGARHGLAEAVGVVADVVERGAGSRADGLRVVPACGLGRGKLAEDALHVLGAAIPRGGIIALGGPLRRRCLEARIGALLQSRGKPPLCPTGSDRPAAPDQGVERAAAGDYPLDLGPQEAAVTGAATSLRQSVPRLGFSPARRRGAGQVVSPAWIEADDRRCRVARPQFGAELARSASGEGHRTVGRACASSTGPRAREGELEMDAAAVLAELRTSPRNASETRMVALLKISNEGFPRSERRGEARANRSTLPKTWCCAAGVAPRAGPTRCGSTQYMVLSLLVYTDCRRQTRRPLTSPVPASGHRGTMHPIIYTSPAPTARLAAAALLLDERRSRPSASRAPSRGLF
jgi:hypothetical protein